MFYPRVIDEIYFIEENIGLIKSIISINDDFISKEYQDEIIEAVQKEEVVKLEENKENQDEPEKQQEEDEENKKPKFIPENYSWSISDGKPKDAVQIFNRINHIEEDVYFFLYLFIFTI